MTKEETKKIMKIFSSLMKTTNHLFVGDNVKKYNIQLSTEDCIISEDKKRSEDLFLIVLFVHMHGLFDMITDNDTPSADLLMKLVTALKENIEIYEVIRNQIEEDELKKIALSHKGLTN
jgi:hypothetical protein